MAAFKVGDKIEDPTVGFGYIVRETIKTDLSGMYYHTYTVRWDRFAGEHEYEAAKLDNVWKKVASPIVAGPPITNLGAPSQHPPIGGGSGGASPNHVQSMPILTGKPAVPNYYHYWAKKDDNGDLIPIEFNCTSPGDQGCTHEWATYQGFRESYSYCKKCDHKKDLE